MSASPIYVWQQPIGWPTPLSLEDLGNQVQKLEVQAQGENVRFVAFAQGLMKRYPPGRPIGDLDPPWEQSVVPDAMASRRCVFKLEPPAGEVDLVEVLRDVVIEASRLGLTVLHEMSGLGFLPDGRVIPASEQGMWEGAKAHVAKEAPAKKLTLAMALKRIVNGIEPTAKKLGFVQRKTELKFNPIEWIRESDEIKQMFLISIDQPRGDIRGGGVAFAISPLINRLYADLKLSAEDHKDYFQSHGITLKWFDKSPDSRRMPSQFEIKSEDDCDAMSRLVASEALLWLDSMKTHSDLDSFLYPGGSTEVAHLDFNNGFFYLMVAYLARNPKLQEIHQSWLDYASKSVHTKPDKLLKAIAYIQANPLPPA